MPEKPLEIIGPDAARLLERVLACRVGTLPVGRARYGIACNEDGTVLMDGVVMRLAEDRYWYVKANGEFESWLKANALGLDVEVSDPNSRVLQIQGPKSLDVLNAAIGGGLPAGFQVFPRRVLRRLRPDVMGLPHRVDGGVGDRDLLQQRPEPTDHGALWDGLFTCGKPFGMEFSSSSSMGIRRIESGILDNGSDIEPDLTPFGAGLGQFVRLDKGDFIGRAALEAADRGQLLFGLLCATATPEAGLEVHRDNSPVGHMTMGTWSPTLETGVGYVRFDQPLPDDDWLGKTVSLVDHDGTPHEATWTPCRSSTRRSGSPAPYGRARRLAEVRRRCPLRRAHGQAVLSEEALGYVLDVGQHGALGPVGIAVHDGLQDGPMILDVALEGLGAG